MEFTSTLYFMATNPNHIEYEQTAYNSEEPIYVWRDNMVYKRQGIWQRDFKKWLSENGIEVDPDYRACYVPIAHVKDNILTGYCTQHLNFSNRLLDMSEASRQAHYPNLYFTEIGDHPYPKQARWHTSWLVDNFHRECHRIIYPHYDPKKFFILPQDILP